MSRESAKSETSPKNQTSSANLILVDNKIIIYKKNNFCKKNFENTKIRSKTVETPEEKISSKNAVVSPDAPGSTPRVPRRPLLVQKRPFG